MCQAGAHRRAQSLFTACHPLSSVGTEEKGPELEFA